MSIISSNEIDHSVGLAKRFAALATSYLDDPAAAKSTRAQVPLENLFRILEMFRYDAFDDEDRGGVLALEGFDKQPQPRLVAVHSPWHSPIETALNDALKAAFDLGQVTKEDAINQLQDGLRGLAKEGQVVKPLAEKVRGFFSTFETSLA